MSVLFTNNAATTLASGINASATSLTVATGTGSLFPSPTGSDYFLITLQSATVSSTLEIVKCTSRSGDVLTIVRAQEGTTGTAFSTGDFVQLRITAGVMNALEQATALIYPVASGAIYENSNTISSNYTVTSGKNAISAGPVTISTGVTVTVPTGSRYVIV